MSNASLAAWLKRETREAHHRIDQHPALKPLIRRDLTLAEYTTALSALYAPVEGLEKVLSSGLVTLGVDYPLIQRAALLKADLHQLGQRERVGGPTAPTPSGLASLVGMLYVLEGSRLGGAMIARHVSHVLGGQVPLRFFSTYPLEADQWRAFWCFAECHCPPSTWPAVREGAQQAFTHFAQGVASEAVAKPNAQRIKAS
jgi:heme oxygenase